MPETKVINVFTAGHCQPCQEFKKLIDDKRVEVDGDPGSILNVMDIETEEGFAALAKVNGDVTGIPAAEYNGQTCKIEVDEEREVVIIKCPKTTSSSSPPV